RRDGDPIRAIIRGVGAASGDTLREATRLAMQRALDSAHLRPEQVAAVEFDGTAIANIDAEPAAAIAEVLGSAARVRPVAIGSLTAQTGHLMAVSGVAG